MTTSEVEAISMAPTAITTFPETVNEPPRRFPSLGLREFWKYRELLYFLVWRDLKVRYKQSVVGVGWTLLQPLATMTLFTLIFGHLVHVPTNGTPYPPFVLTGLIAWQLFAFALGQSATSLTLSTSLITKVYFPRPFIPTARVLAGLVDFLIAGVVLAGFLALYDVIPPGRVVLLPVVILLLVIAALGVSFWLSALNVQYRDVQYAMTFLTQFWFFATPIVYSSAIVPGNWRLVLGLNPMAGVVELLRWSLFRSALLPSGLIVVSASMAVVLFVTGFLYFRSAERTFADLI